MSARDTLLDLFLTGGPGSQPEFEAALDAHRAEAAAERDNEIVDWLLKKAREYRSTGSQQHAVQAQAIESMADKISRGAVREAPRENPERARKEQS